MSTRCVWHGVGFEVNSGGSLEALEEWSLVVTASTSSATQLWNGFDYSSMPLSLVSCLCGLKSFLSCSSWEKLESAPTVSSTQSRVTWGGNLHCSDQICPRAHLWDSVLVVNWCRKAQPTMGGTFPWAGGLEMCRKPTVQEPMREPEITVLHSFCFNLLLMVLSWLSSKTNYDLGSINQTNRFLS